MIILTAAPDAMTVAIAQSDNAVPFQVTDPIAAGGITVDGAGVIYVTDRDHNVIRKITPQGEVSIFAGSPGRGGSADGEAETAQFHTPEGVAIDGAGNVYVADSDNHAVRKITPDGVVSTLASRASARSAGQGDQFQNPHRIALDEAANVYVLDGGVIRKITPAGVLSILAVLPDKRGRVKDAEIAQSQIPGGLAIDARGNLYVADVSAYVIYKISSDGAVSTFAGTALKSGADDGTGSVARFYAPHDVATDQAGNLFVADTMNLTVRKVTPDGVVTTLAGAHHIGDVDGPGNMARFYGPECIATDRAGNVYVSDNGHIRKITPDGVASTLDGLFMRGDIAGAIAVYTRTVEVLPDQSDTGKTARQRAYNSRGKLRLQQGDFAGAIADFEAALRINPQSPVYKQNLARAKAAAEGR